MNNLLHVIGTCAVVTAIAAGAELALDRSARHVRAPARQDHAKPPAALFPRAEVLRPREASRAGKDHGARTAVDHPAPRPVPDDETRPAAAADASRGPSIGAAEAQVRGLATLDPVSSGTDGSLAVRRQDTTLDDRDAAIIDRMPTASIASGAAGPAASEPERFGGEPRRSESSAVRMSPAERAPRPSTGLPSRKKSDTGPESAVRSRAESREPAVENRSEKAPEPGVKPAVASRLRAAPTTGPAAPQRPRASKGNMPQGSHRVAARQEALEARTVKVGPAAFRFSVSGNSCHASGSFGY